MPVIIRSVDNIQEKQNEIARIYADFDDKTELLAHFAVVTEQAGAAYYAGEFNSKLIAGALVENQDNKRVITHLAVHAATRGRGVGNRVLSEVVRLEKAGGVETLYAVKSLSSGDFNSALHEAGFESQADEELVAVKL